MEQAFVTIWFVRSLSRLISAILKPIFWLIGALIGGALILTVRVTAWLFWLIVGAVKRQNVRRVG